MMYLMGSKKHSGGWMEENIGNICAQSKLAH